MKRNFIIGFGLTAVLFSSVLTGCASASKKAAEPAEAPVTDVIKNVPEQGYQPDAHYSHIDLTRNEQVDQWIHYFTGRGRKFMHLYLERSARYMPLMKATFRERGMPDELAYIAMIESGFSATAFSNASAVGYWQFIRSTGKRYNLRIDPYIDERRDPILSTEAAANFLDTLYSIFGDWHLSLAAYNAGEQRILNAMSRKHTREFWALSKIRRALPKETKNYIPKFIAAVLIAEHPEEYGFTDIDSQPAFTFDSAVIDHPISLETMAGELGVDYDELKLMNPRYKSDYVPVYNDRINAVRVPVGMKEQAALAIPKSASEAPRHYVASFEYYHIRRGETLSHIAKRFHTSVAKLRDLNDLSSRTMIRAGKKIKVPEGFVVASASRGPANAASVSGDDSSDDQPAVSHKKKHKKKKSAAAKAVEKTADSDSSDSSSEKVHIVKQGENLSTIAKKYRCSVAKIARANSLRHRSRLMAGTELIIPD